MKTFMFIFLLLTIITSKVLGQQCGLNNAGALMQKITDTPMTIAQGLFYDPDTKEMYAVDRCKACLHVFDTQTAESYHVDISDVKKYISAVYPIKNSKNKMIGLADNKIMYLYLQRDSNNTIVKITTQEIKVVEKDKKVDFKYSIVDKKGRIWIDMATANLSQEVKGKVVQIGKDFSVKDEIESMMFPTGMGYSPDNSIYYQIDAHENVVYKYDFDNSDGTIRNPKVIYNLTEEIHFSGDLCSMEVASDNTLWLGLCGSGIVLNYNWKQKQYVQIHKIPLKVPQSIELGGAGMKILFVAGYTTFPKDSKPIDGAVYAISGTGSTGTPSNKCKE